MATKRIARKPFRSDRIINQKRLSTERHLGMTIAEWRFKKRQQWRVLEHALKAFEFGAAYAPVGNDLYTVRQCVDRVSEAMGEDWVCW